MQGDIREEKSLGKEKGMGRKSLKSLLSLTAALLLVPLFTNGELATKKSLLFFFDKIEIKGDVDVFLVKGKRSREVTLFADSEIIDSVYTKVKSKTLYILSSGIFNGVKSCSEALVLILAWWSLFSSKNCLFKIM